MHQAAGAELPPDDVERGLCCAGAQQAADLALCGARGEVRVRLGGGNAAVSRGGLDLSGGTVFEPAGIHPIGSLFHRIGRR